MKAKGNHLVQETSPYLLQHAYNPVDWYPWGEEALDRARAENKPILVSIGYAACHWCHVMERESFEDEATAAFMNKHFINIKIDREERPDLDHIYMDAVQAMTGSGGWPLNVFLTPDKKPFYGGTYFPPRRAFNRSSWLEVLEGVSKAFRERRHEIDAQAEDLTNHMLQSNAFGMQPPGADWKPGDKVAESVKNILGNADLHWGGFGNAPKFPQTFTIQFLLRYHHSMKERDGDQVEESLNVALLSLDKMIEGGIYDQLGGGLARYSTDREWLAPHFEKMLYDNALLVSVLSEAYQLTGHERYREVIMESIGFVERELMHPQKGFYSALDADSEGVEGKFYVWEKREVDELLGPEAEVFCRYYDISPGGNWEGKNILRVRKPFPNFAREEPFDEKTLRNILEKGKQALMKEREKRVRPQLDDKIILGWNALMNTACSKAFAATGHAPFRDLAIANMDFLLSAFVTESGSLHHTWKNGRGRYPAFLDDYAYLIQALLHLQEVTGNKKWLTWASELARFVLSSFSEWETGFFFYTPDGQPDVIVRKKEVYDGATPSGNAVMADNLHRLGILIDEPEWRERSFDLLRSLAPVISKYPTSFGCWNCLLLENFTGTAELAVTGAGWKELYQKLLRKYIPHRVLMGGENDDKDYPLLAGKNVEGKTLIYVCRNFVCLQPVERVEEVMSLINNDRGQN